MIKECALNFAAAPVLCTAQSSSCIFDVQLRVGNATLLQNPETIAFKKPL